MTGFEPGSTGIVSNRAVNCATTTLLTYCSLTKCPLTTSLIELFLLPLNKMA